ncbi:MAG: hypothetical protein ACKVVP_16275 [Chloroflexota bacterium]
MTTIGSGTFGSLRPNCRGGPAELRTVELTLQEQCVVNFYRSISQAHPRTGDLLEELLEQVSSLSCEIRDGWHAASPCADYRPARPHIVWELGVILEPEAPDQAALDAWCDEQDVKLGLVRDTLTPPAEPWRGD